MGHIENDVGITNYNPDGFSKRLLQRRVNAVEIDISMIRAPFGESSGAQITHLSDRRMSM